MDVRTLLSLKIAGTFHPSDTQSCSPQPSIWMAEQFSGTSNDAIQFNKRTICEFVLSYTSE